MHRSTAPAANAKPERCNNGVNMTALLAVLAVAFISCNTASPMAPLALKITTDGGFAGRGVGSLTIDGEKAATERCDGTLTASERESLTAALAALKKLKLRDSYGKVHPDAVQWTLEFDGRKTSWYDGNDLPKELGELRESAWKARNRVNTGCR